MTLRVAVENVKRNKAFGLGSPRLTAGVWAGARRAVALCAWRASSSSPGSPSPEDPLAGRGQCAAGGGGSVRV